MLFYIDTIELDDGSESLILQVHNLLPFRASFFCYATILRFLSSLNASGGLELLCDSVKIHNVNVEPQAEGKKLTMKHLLSWVRTNLIKERPEMFMKGDTVRPGVLVLVNDCDWELSGQLETVLEEKDVVVFISTLHGG
ncbi:UNVERIFIED_CONTAM: Ubiquitin-related modifier 11 [Sesamum radiatum]|uniref:Ubiquitin-related modifier 1 homolog n=1 Tax=Sesamum radiatum TaxID=300843 RepID=A0AAW2PXU5_SESRA